MNKLFEKKLFSACAVLLYLSFFCLSCSGLCKDEDILRCLSKNGTDPECIIDHVEYCFPTTIWDFIENGWGIDSVFFDVNNRVFIEEYKVYDHNPATLNSDRDENHSEDAKTLDSNEDENVLPMGEVKIPAKSSVEVLLFKIPDNVEEVNEYGKIHIPEETISIFAKNPWPQEVSFVEAIITGVEIQYYSAAEFVTWFGICSRTPRRTLVNLAKTNKLTFESAHHKQELLDNSWEYCYLTNIYGQRMIRIEYSDYGRQVHSILVFSEE